MIVSCKKYQNRVNHIKNKWLNSCPINYVILTADPNLDKNYIYTESNKSLVVKSADEYEYLPHKVKYGVSALIDLFNPEYILKCDDDVLINNNMLMDYVKLMIEEHHDYHGKYWSYKEGEFTNYAKKKFNENQERFYFYTFTDYFMGPLYFLSNKSCKIIKDKMDPGLCKYEDINVGLTLKNNGIKINRVRQNLYVFDFDIVKFKKIEKMAWTPEQT